MIRLFNIFRFIWRSERKALWRGIALTVLVLSMGAALLGLSGWFIVATGVAGLISGAAGTAASGMNVFLPSAGVRGLALGRTAARYGERLLTHDATLRALAALRVHLLHSFSRLSYRKVLRLRGAEALNRLTADVDALDGIALRLIIPLIGGTAVLILAFFLLWGMIGSSVALGVIASLLAGVAAAFWISLRRARKPARLSEYALQAFRVRVVDLMRGQTPLIVAGQLPRSVDSALDAERRMRAASLKVASAERQAGFMLSVAATVSAGVALFLSVELVRAGALGAAYAAMGFFLALGLSETVLALHKGMAELGRMSDAARRVSSRMEQVAESERPPEISVRNTAMPLEIQALNIASMGEEARALSKDLNLSVEPGKTVGLTGRSGAGKSTLLAAVAGLVSVQDGRILIFGREIDHWPERQLRVAMGVLMQRSALMSGTIREALALANPDATDAQMNEVLKAVALRQVIGPHGGLSMRLGEAGAGLSGGEQRRLALARVLIRHPEILLLDEPCEGLDDKTARIVLQGVRRICPNAAILVATHRPAETEWCDTVYRICL